MAKKLLDGTQNSLIENQFVVLPIRNFITSKSLQLIWYDSKSKDIPYSTNLEDFFCHRNTQKLFSELFSQKQFTVKSEHRERSIATRHSRQNNNSKLAPKQNSQFRLYPASAIHSELGRSCFVIKTNEKKNHAELQFSLVYTARWYRLGTQWLERIVELDI